jgi:SAM-dependent methyltransferase
MQAENGYDRLAEFYERYWDREYHDQAFEILERLLLRTLSSGSRILDLCCGTGHISVKLVRKGYLVTGIDKSHGMLGYAREKLPEAEFMLADASAFSLPPIFHAAISTFESISHILKFEELISVFRNTYEALMPGAFFVFDINTEESYRELWHKRSAIIGEDHICIIKGAYDPDTIIGRTDITLLRFSNNMWDREEIRIQQRGYSPETISSALRHAGYVDIEFYDADRDLEMKGDPAVGRIFFRARKKFPLG